jgi:hypothetical protein
MKWALKHANPNKNEVQSSVKSLLSRLLIFCTHSSKTKRIGAALIFNRIYTLFRESELLIDVFTFEIFIGFLTSLKLADGESEGNFSNFSTFHFSHSLILFLKKHLIFKSNFLSAT